MSSYLNTQNSILNLSNRIEINDSFLDSLLKKIDKKNRIKELLLSRTNITHLPKRETLLLFPNLEKNKYNRYTNNKKSRLYYYKL